MDKKYIYIGIGLMVLLFLSFTMPKYFATNSTASETRTSGDIEKLEIIHFHGTNQCSSCIAVGDLAGETINTYFENELKSGKITFEHLNGELPQNKEKVVKYGATGSSLWIGTYFKDGSFQKEENINVWYKINDRAEYLSYLQGLIESKLMGN